MWTFLPPFAASAGHWVVDSRPAIGDIWHDMAVPAALRSVLAEVTAAPEEEAQVLDVEKEPVGKLLPQTFILLVLELPPEFPVIEENKNEQARVITCQYVWMYLMGPDFLAIMITCFGIHLSNFCLVVILSTRLSHQVGAKRWITKIGTSRFSEPFQEFSNQKLSFLGGLKL